MDHHELLSLDRLLRVLRGYNAHTAPKGSDGREAYEQLRRLMRFRLGQKIQYRVGKDDAWHDGVVISYMQMPPQFVCGPGDSRKTPKGAKLWGLCERDIRRRDSHPAASGGKGA